MAFLEGEVKKHAKCVFRRNPKGDGKKGTAKKIINYYQLSQNVCFMTLYDDL